MNLSNNKILITGGGSGIGLGLTERFILENNTVIICGRREELLKEVSDRYDNVIAYTCDLSTQSGREELYNWVSKEHSDLNVLVNNAGIQNWMHIDDADFYDKAKLEVETNVMAPLHLTSMFVKLKELNTVINVTSGLAYVQIAKVPVYCATKAFFHSFTLSLRHMLKDRNIEAIEVIPPAINTDLGGKGIHAAYPQVSDFVEAVFQQLYEGKQEITWGFSEDMAKASPEVIAETFDKMNAA
ncbi:SDR family NAD(P)-dependent oxidoreductase [Fulvivirga sp. 29W222]|uniref:SDR family NAD(P)-dependent oxidoreductase n=1 Tax=Fulvivirga marina TaxID=2494733 RepID=A0A937G006_9BACT|nr:SDR family NAD(P)-dependent oxidoreductase [Fulvivirga marina]MBL6449290.1 SDR family NAD(P)-dependent oxidoreductase [Fulvivirga marina]